MSYTERIPVRDPSGELGYVISVTNTPVHKRLSGQVQHVDGGSIDYTYNGEDVNAQPDGTFITVLSEMKLVPA